MVKALIVKLRSVLAVSPVTALALAVDAPQLTVTNNYSWYPWTVDVTGTNTHDGLCAARSPQIWDWSAAPFSTVVAGPGTQINSYLQATSSCNNACHPKVGFPNPAFWNN